MTVLCYKKNNNQLYFLIVYVQKPDKLFHNTLSLLKGFRPFPDNMLWCEKLSTAFGKSQICWKTQTFHKFNFENKSYKYRSLHKNCYLKIK